MPKILNKPYRDFLDNGLIKTLGPEDLKLILSNIKVKEPRYVAEGRSLVICLYYTGARPSEILELRAKDFTLEGSYLVIRVPGKKRGLTRPVYLQKSVPDIAELHKFTRKYHPDYLIFWHYRSPYVREVTLKNGEVRTYVETTSYLRNRFKLWTRGVLSDELTPYYLRHNRFSKLAEQGATAEDIRQLKGSRSLSSVLPYLHLSALQAKKIARKIR